MNKQLSLKNISIILVSIALVALLMLSSVLSAKLLKSDVSYSLSEIERVRISYEKQSKEKLLNILTPVLGEKNFVAEISVQMQYNLVKEVVQTIIANKKEIKERTSSPGEIKRISVSVIVDKDLTDVEILDLQELVASTVGFDVDRKDKATIKSVPFDRFSPAKKSFLLELYFLKILPAMIFIGFLFACLFLYRKYFPTNALSFSAEKKIPIQSYEKAEQEIYEEIEYEDEEILKMKDELISTIIANPVDSANRLSQYAKGVE